MKGIVYGLYCVCEECESARPGEIRYVGVTVKTLRHRFRAHLVESHSASDKAKDRWIRKHGQDNIRIREIESGISSIEELRVAEVAWIASLGTYDSSAGLNMTRGGEGIWGYKFSDAIRQRFKERTAIQMSQKHPRAKLTHDDVAKIIGRIWAGETSTNIAADYSVSVSTIQKIRSGDNWPEVTRPKGSPPPVSRERRGSGSPIPIATQQKVWDEHTGEWGENRRLAIKYGLSEATISLIVNGRRKMPKKIFPMG